MQEALGLKQLDYRRLASVQYRSREASNVETTTSAHVLDANIRGQARRSKACVASTVAAIV
jgi:hypothetical protein